MKPFQCSMFSLALLIGLAVLAPPNHAHAAISPGDRLHAPVPSTPSTRPPLRSTAADVNFNGLYVYTTPSASPRWVRLQQSGNVVWGTIDVNSNFSMCSRTRLDGTVSGNSVSFTAALNTHYCPCGGPGASISFLGTIDATGVITGEWSNTCGGRDSWTACSTSTSGLQAACTAMPDNEPPVPIALVPALPSWGAWMLALSLLLLSVFALRSARVARALAR